MTHEEHETHDGHWECTLHGATEELYRAALMVLRVAEARPYRSALEQYALKKLSLAVARAEGRDLVSETETPPARF